ncbi:hypothetical protein [Ruminococcus sp.]|nr:hypothetical protein [Ruminococcus sp.]
MQRIAIPYRFKSVQRHIMVTHDETLKEAGRRVIILDKASE